MRGLSVWTLIIRPLVLKAYHNYNLIPLFVHNMNIGQAISGPLGRRKPQMRKLDFWKLINNVTWFLKVSYDIKKWIIVVKQIIIVNQ